MPSLSVCLLLDERADAAVRRLWRRLEDDEVASLASYTHGRHVPHLTLVSLGDHRLSDVRDAMARVPDGVRIDVVFSALAVFTRTRCSLAVAPGRGLLHHHRGVHDALDRAGLEAHRHYRPGSWLPHLTVSPRLPVDSLPRVARRAYEVLPLQATLVRTALVDTGTGEVHDLHQSTSGGKVDR